MPVRSTFRWLSATLLDGSLSEFSDSIFVLGNACGGEVSMHNYARVGRRHGRGARAWHFHIGHRQLVTLPIQEWPRLARARRLRHRGNERGVRCGVAEAAEAEPPVAAAMHAQGDAGATGLLGLPELQRAKGSKVPE